MRHFPRFNTLENLSRVPSVSYSVLLVYTLLLGLLADPATFRTLLGMPLASARLAPRLVDTTAEAYGARMEWLGVVIAIAIIFGFIAFLVIAISSWRNRRQRYPEGINLDIVGGCHLPPRGSYKSGTWEVRKDGTDAKDPSGGGGSGLGSGWG